MNNPVSCIGMDGNICFRYIGTWVIIIAGRGSCLAEIEEKSGDQGTC